MTCPRCAGPTFPCPTPRGYRLACSGYFKGSCAWVSRECIDPDWQEVKWVEMVVCLEGKEVLP